MAMEDIVKGRIDEETRKALNELIEETGIKEATHFREAVNLYLYAKGKLAKRPETVRETAPWADCSTLGLEGNEIESRFRYTKNGYEATFQTKRPLLERRISIIVEGERAQFHVLMDLLSLNRTVKEFCDRKKSDALFLRGGLDADFVGNKDAADELRRSEPHGGKGGGKKTDGTT